ncbi:DUF397 domain-containing protein [Kitasatospora sp. NPDC094011]|uniref:DUF397 domain-containing protein n=1 Tax=Kitasatospora sp. NPDC094011 TaxID=3364090 RepID=UPI003805B695
MGEVELQPAGWQLRRGGTRLADGMPARDSKDPEGPVLLFPIAAWQSFIDATVAGEFGEV